MSGIAGVFATLGPRLPESLEDPGLLVGWSLEHEHRRRPMGFNFGDPAVSPAQGYLDPVLLEGEGHLVTIAPTGAGKGVGAIIPTLLRYEGPVIVIDPKGENYAVTARRRRALGHRVVVIDPMGVTGAESDRLNPFDAIEPLKAGDVDDVAALTSALFTRYVGERNTFWVGRAMELIIAVTLHVLTSEPAENRHLGRVREIVSASSRQGAEIADLLSDSPHPEARLVARNLLIPAAETFGGIISFAQEALAFVRGGEVQEAVAASTFPLGDVTEGKPLSIFIVVPPDKLESHAPLLRLWISALMQAIVRRRRKPPKSTLFILDEAAQLGGLPHLRQAMTLMRGYGLQTWSFWQDVSQIQRLYADDWPTMVNNARVLQAFGANTLLAARGVAELTGFADAHAVLALEPEEMILQIAGDEAVIARKPNYLADPAFAGLADENPFYATSGEIAPPARPPSRWYMRQDSVRARGGPPIRMEDLERLSEMLERRRRERSRGRLPSGDDGNSAL
jgi:type IV secretion system protein VirD4